MAAKVKHIQRFGPWLVAGAGAVVMLFGLLLSGPAEAQRGGGLFDNWFGTFPSAPRSAPAAPQADFSRAPPARKPDVQPNSTVLVLGDSMADWLAYGLEDALADTPEIGVTRKHRTYSGLLRYERADGPDWAQVARDLIAAEKPTFVVMMLGLNDRQSIRERVATPPGRGAPAATAQPAPSAQPSPQPVPDADRREPENQEQPAVSAPEPPRPRVAGVHEFRSDKWAELYAKRVDDTIAALKGRGLSVFWVGLPSVRGAKSTSDMLYLNDLFRTRAEKAGVTFIDVWDGFVDENGRFALQGPDFEGQIRRLRTGDGVHFTKAGARKLAHYVEREIRRASLRGPVEVALPSSEPQPTTPGGARPGGATARPLAGPVLPLTAATTGAGENLLGGANSSANPGHVTTTRVLVKGEAVEPPAGRGDDFTWPRRGVAPFGTDPVVATTTLPLPVMQPAPEKTVLAPSAEAPAAPAVRRPAAPRPQQAQAPQRQQSSPFSFFQFFR
jgi:hypothetical protein